MTFRTTVVGADGKAIEGAFVQANVENVGLSYTRFTDGNGYADVAILRDPPMPAGYAVTFVVEADGYRRSNQYLTTGSSDQNVMVTLVPFENL